MKNEGFWHQYYLGYVRIIFFFVRNVIVVATIQFMLFMINAMKQ